MSQAQDEQRQRTIKNIVTSITILIITSLILRIIDRLFFGKKRSGLQASLKEDSPTILAAQNRQPQEDVPLLADTQEQQRTPLHRQTEEPIHTVTDTEPDSNWHRLTLFSDGVFAIAITLLILDIHLPGGAYYLADNLEHITKSILVFAYTFLFIGFFWNLHRQIFRYIARINTRFVMLNLLVLLSIVFMPFPTSLLYEYDDTTVYHYDNAQVAGRFYAGSMVVLGLFFVVLWLYASRKRRLLNDHASAKIIKHYYFAILFPTIVYFVTFCLTFIGANYSIPPINLGIYYYYITGVDLSQFIWLILPLGLLGYNFLRGRTD